MVFTRYLLGIYLGNLGFLRFSEARAQESSSFSLRLKARLEYSKKEYLIFNEYLFIYFYLIWIFLFLFVILS